MNNEQQELMDWSFWSNFKDSYPFPIIKTNEGLNNGR